MMSKELKLFKAAVKSSTYESSSYNTVYVPSEDAYYYVIAASFEDAVMLLNDVAFTYIEQVICADIRLPPGGLAI